MKTRSRITKKSRRNSPLRRVVAAARKPKEPTLLDRIAQITDELQTLRSRLANAGDDLPAVGTHRIAALETELERLWEMRRHEQASALRRTALSDQEEEALAFPSGGQARGS